MTLNKLPKGWIQSPRRGYLIADLFYPMKTILDERYKDLVPESNIFSIDFLRNQADMYRIVLLIDLIDSERYYKSSEMKDVLQIKITISGENSLPTSKQITAFIKIVNKNIELDNDGKIAVHCTRGYSKTGFMIVNYLVTQRGIPLHEALQLFAKSRPPGIYKPKYLKYLATLHQPNLPIHYPTPPAWEYVSSAEHSTERSKRRPEHKSRDRREDRSVDRLKDRLEDKSVEKAKVRLEDKSVDRPKDRLDDKSVEKSKYRLEDRSMGRLEDRLEDRSVNRSRDKREDRSRDRLVETSKSSKHLLSDHHRQQTPKYYDEEMPYDEPAYFSPEKPETNPEECPESKSKHKHSPILGKKRSSALLEGSIKIDSLKKRRIEEDKPEPSRIREINLNKRIPKFLMNMYLKDEKTVNKLREELQNILQTTMYGFVGHKYKLLTGKLLRKYTSRDFYHTWRTDGKRYLLFILDGNRIYLIDEQNRYYKVGNLNFSHPHIEGKSLTGTILDGELVEETIASKTYYQFLISDIYALEGNRIYQQSYSIRLSMIQEFIMDVRKEHAERKSSAEPFDIMMKTISDRKKLLKTWNQLKKTIAHSMTGLIFYPYKDISYTFLGRAYVYIWIPTIYRYIKFKLKAVNDKHTNKWIGLLYVYGDPEHFSKIKYLTEEEKQKYDGKIVRCFMRQGFWKISKHDPDDTVPISKWDVNDEIDDWQTHVAFKELL